MGVLLGLWISAQCVLLKAAAPPPPPFSHGEEVIATRIAKHETLRYDGYSRNLKSNSSDK